MKYDEFKISKSYSYPNDNISVGKIGKKRKFGVLDALLVPAICSALISTTVLVTRFVASGMLTSLVSALSIIG